MIRKILLISISLISLSCSKNSKENEIKSFSEKIILDSKETGIKILSKGNIGLLVVDTLLIVQKSNEPFLEIYNTNSHVLLKTFGEYGEGPEKILNPVLTKGIEYENGNSIITLFDFTKRLINKINLNKLFQNDEQSLIQKTVPFTGNYISYFHYADENILITTIEGTGRFTNYIFKNDLTIDIPYIPNLPFTSNKIKFPIIYRSTTNVNKRKKIFSAFPLFKNSIDYFDFDGNLIQTTNFGNPNDLEKYIGINAELEPYYFVMDSDSDENFIYGLNMNNRLTDLRGLSPKKVSILVFDWEGNTIKEYILNNKQASESIAFDSLHNRFYTYCRDCEESNILIFHINE